MVKLFLRIFAFLWCVISIFHLIDQKRHEQHDEIAVYNGENKHISDTILVRSPEAYLPVPSPTPARRQVQGVLLDEDSLARMYDGNYMDYDHHEYNPHDDDEWHDYYND